jgi:hypothetical protein
MTALYVPAGNRDNRLEAVIPRIAVNFHFAAERKADLSTAIAAASPSG